MALLFRLSLFLLLFTAVFQNAYARELARVDASHSSLSVHSELTTVAKGESVWLAITITPRTGWHSYWKNSGDSGAAPEFDWNFNGDAMAGDLLFPAPKPLPFGPLMNYGYDAAVSLLVPISVTGSGDRLYGQVEAEWLICELECVPQVASFDVSIPLGAVSIDQNEVSLFKEARSALPDPSFWDSHLTITPANSELTVYMAEDEAGEIASAYFFPVGDGVVDYAAAQSWKRIDDGILLEMQRFDGSPDVSEAGGVLRVTYLNGEEAAFELEPALEMVASSLVDPVVQTTSMPIPLWQAALFALLGGLILNLMPCVFPILSLKAFAFVSANYKTAANRKKEGLAYTFGIWISFMAIVSVLLAMRAGGTAVGWGFQLQEPVFVALMTVLMVVVALSLSGMFSIQLGIEGAGQNLAAREGVHGAFFKGILATLVATPCTAPFMAPAVGYALTQPLLIVFFVFTFLALGLALPFLLLSYSPGLARMMPKPGPWMEKVKEALAFPMYLTAAWLLYVFDRSVGAVGTFMLVVAIVGIVFAIWLYKQAPGKVGRSVSLLVAIGSILLVITEPWQEPARDPSGLYVEELNFTQETLASKIQQGQSIFVYFTADWCITCKANERVAILTETTQQAFANTNTVVVKGDWTNRNDEIAAILATHGRAGVPLYLYYPAGESTPIVLPELLGPKTVSELLYRHNT